MTNGQQPRRPFVPYKCNKPLPILRTCNNRYTNTLQHVHSTVPADGYTCVRADCIIWIHYYSLKHSLTLETIVILLSTNVHMHFMRIPALNWFDNHFISIHLLKFCPDINILYEYIKKSYIFMNTCAGSFDKNNKVEMIRFFEIPPI